MTRAHLPGTAIENHTLLSISLITNGRDQLKIFEAFPEAAKYAAIVTPYAYQKKQRNIKSMERVDLTATENNYTANSSEGIIKVKTDSCSCSTWTSLHLPCKHVLAVHVPLFRPPAWHTGVLDIYIPLYTCTPVCQRTSLLSSTPACESLR